MQTSETIHPDKSPEQAVKHVERSMGSILKVEEREGIFYIIGEKVNLAVAGYGSKMFRLKFYFGEHVDLFTTEGIVSGGVEQRPLTLAETNTQYILQNGDLKLTADKTTFQIHLNNRNDETIMSMDKITWDQRGTITGFFRQTGDSHFYGLGEKTSYLDKQGESYTMWNSDVYAPHVPEIEALYESIPFMIHMKNGRSYGVFLDNPARTTFDMRTSQKMYTVQCSVGDFDLYIMDGPDMKEVISQYTALTGRMPLPAQWAIGYHQSRYSYMNQEEVLELARTFRAKQIPCDVIFLDIHYMDEYRVFTFDSERFPDPKGMMEELKTMGFRIVPIVDPGVKQDARYPIYRDGVLNDYFCKKIEGDMFIGNVWPGASAFPDFTDDKVQKWWGENHKYYVDLGIQGIWNDMNEPAVFNDSKTMDLDVVHKNNGKLKTHEELHNIYGMLMSKATYEGLKEQMDGDRPFVLTRAGYSGVQRYAAVWTGDNRSFWEHMAMAIPMVLNLGLSGIPFAGPDIGGFAHHTSGELLARWTQMGVFFPYCRNHSAIQTLRQEPWSFGPEVEEICRTYISMRYRFMPYLYNLFYKASVTGMPVIRPLVLEYPNDPLVTNLCDQFLLGSDIIVAPIYRPNTVSRSVYLPEGVWYDYWTNERLEGGRHILADAPLDKLPMYVRAGAIIPEAPVTQSADEYALSDSLIFNMYGTDAISTSSYTLYEDDGKTFAYQNDSYNLLKFDYEGQNNALQISYGYEHQGYQADENVKGRTFTFVIQACGFIPQEVKGVNAVALEQLSEVREGWHYNEATRELRIKVEANQISRTLVIA